ncbi:MAG: 16S rRNA (guanine(966)-N(2))-methyltransferase RsmD [Candidatus Brocadiae bacterium]|nr:16S rRNA (guanine(966)-N(2))-methyltransferase RsmD [Candidatus Brocadiia bacterium]
MKIIAGDAKGLKLESPPGMQTRPMNIRVRESVFDLLQDKVQDALVLDLFAGSGSLGLEALSRGARFCYFLETCKETQQVLVKNINNNHFKERSKLISYNAFHILKIWQETEPCQIVFFDPPYHYFDNPITRRECVQYLGEIAKKITQDKGLMVLHYRKGAMAGMPVLPPLHIIEDRVYGSTEIMVLEVKNSLISL